MAGLKIEFSAEALADPSSFRYLTSIAWMVVDGRHRWIIPEPKEFLESRWFTSEGGPSQRTFRETARSSRSPSRPELEVRSLAAERDWREGCWRLPANQADEALREPLIAVTENARCDGEFLRKIVLLFGEQRLKRHLGDEGFERLRSRWRGPFGDGERLRVLHGGGSATAQQIEFAVETGVPGIRRIFVLVDSDRESPGAPEGDTAKSVAKKVQQLQSREPNGPQLQFHVLKKREVENYLPGEVLRASNSKAHADWQRLSLEEKDFTDLKRCFGDKLWKALVRDENQRHLHQRALAERAGENGKELIEIATRVIELL